MDAIEKRANGVALNGLDEQRLRNHQLRMMRRAWLKDMKVRECSLTLFIRLRLEDKQNINNSMNCILWSCRARPHVLLSAPSLYYAAAQFIDRVNLWILSSSSHPRENHFGRSTTCIGARQTSCERTLTSPTTGSSFRTSSFSPRASVPSIHRLSLTSFSMDGRWRVTYSLTHLLLL